MVLSRASVSNLDDSTCAALTLEDTSHAEPISGTSGIETLEGTSDLADLEEVGTQREGDCSPEHEWIVLVVAL